MKETKHDILQSEFQNEQMNFQVHVTNNDIQRLYPKAFDNVASILFWSILYDYHSQNGASLFGKVFLIKKLW